MRAKKTQIKDIDAMEQQAMMQEKYEAGMNQWRLEAPEKFVIRIAQYLSHQYPDAMKVIKAVQQ
jgi:hypothetical protein